MREYRYTHPDAGSIVRAMKSFGKLDSLMAENPSENALISVGTILGDEEEAELVLDTGTLKAGKYRDESGAVLYYVELNGDTVFSAAIEDGEVTYVDFKDGDWVRQLSMWEWGVMDNKTLKIAEGS